MGRTRTITNILPRLALCVTLLFLTPTTSNAQDKTPLFVFGDSLFDGGMTLYNGVKGAGAEFWPYGETYFNRPTGRYSDGRNIPDFIAQFAGLPLLPPYLQPGLNDYSLGVNFAAASACVLIETRPGTVNLAMQMYYFVQMVDKLQQQVGEIEANRLLSKAVYLINIAGNDLFSLFETNKEELPLPFNMKREYVDWILGNLTTHIYQIYNQGGRKFAFLNIGPLGCMPAMKAMLKYGGSCVEEGLDLARMYNAEFAALANRLQIRLPGFKHSVYDFHISLYLRVLNGHRYGFKESETACCGSGPFNGRFTCQNKDTSFSVCSNPTDFVWFDAAHTTDRANEQFASEFWLGGPDIVGPYNLQRLFAMS